MTDNPAPLVVITGMTGAGRSTAAKELEDIGYFVVDNLPSGLLGELVERVDKTLGPTTPIAVVMDVRSGSFFESLRPGLAQPIAGRRASLLFLEADDNVLVRRQEAARRPHPLQSTDRLLDGLRRERKVLAPLRGDADLLIDTTALNVHQLTAKVAAAYGTPDSLGLRITVTSFGFKYGIPVDADFVADMRFLPNPFWIPELSGQTGQDGAVVDYVKGQDGAAEFLAVYPRVLRIAADHYLDEGKRFMTVAIGCTGGKHRSVAIAEALATTLRDDGYDVHVAHRDLGRE